MHRRLGRRTAFGLSAQALAVAALLSACASGPDYQIPSASDAPFHNAALLQQRDAGDSASAMPPLDQWWEGFKDPQLTEVIRRALDQNLDLAASLARVEQARAAAEASGARKLPQAAFNSDAARARQSLQSPLGKIASRQPGYERTQTLYEVGAGASWELDLSGALQRGVEAAGAEQQAAEAQHMGVRISIAAEAADAYFRIRGAQARIGLARHQVDTSNELLRIVRLRLQDGMSTRGEMAQAESRLAQTRSLLPPLYTELERQLNRLDVLMGARPGTYSQQLGGLAGLTVVPVISVADGSAALLRRRPDVIAAERTLAASNARIGVAMAEYYPKLSLSALAGFQSLGAAGLFSADSVQAQAGFGLRWRLFDFGRVDAEIAHAKGVNAEALARYRQAMLHATEDVENAIASLVQLELQSKELNAEVDAQMRARTASEEAYKGGVVSLSEVLTEDRLLLAAQDQLAQVHADNARAAVSAFRALGGGW
jgi:NodT family efflux transporter outer membrane factor (OMF) lipoprotein